MSERQGIGRVLDEAQAVTASIEEQLVRHCERIGKVGYLTETDINRTEILIRDLKQFRDRVTVLRLAQIDINTGR